MAITNYAKGEHPAGFIGWRVVVPAGNHRVYQRYFTARPPGQEPPALWARLQHLRARHYDAQMQARMILRQYRWFIRTNSRQVSEVYGVGAHGIRMYARPLNNAPAGWEFGFLVGRGRGKSDALFAIQDEGHTLTQAWQHAIDYWAKRHEVRDKDRQAKLDNPPLAERFKALRRHLNSQGKDIPASALGPVYREQREALARARAKETLKRKDLNDELAEFHLRLKKEIETATAQHSTRKEG